MLLLLLPHSRLPPLRRRHLLCQHRIFQKCRAESGLRTTSMVCSLSQEKQCQSRRGHGKSARTRERSAAPGNATLHPHLSPPQILLPPLRSLLCEILCITLQNSSAVQHLHTGAQTLGTYISYIIFRSVVIYLHLNTTANEFRNIQDIIIKKVLKIW